MTIHDEINYLSEVLIRKAVKFWAKRNPNTVDMKTITKAYGKRYHVHIRRCDYKKECENADD